MEQGQGQTAIGPPHRLRKEQRILVIQGIEVGAAVGGEAGQAAPPPAHQVARDGQGNARAGQGNARAGRPQRRVGHHVEAARREEGDAWIFHPAAALAVELIRLLGL